MWHIGNVEIKNKVVLAPMAGISNHAYRKIIKEMKAGLIYAEMVSDKAICFDNKKTLDMLYMSDIERPIAQQIFGSDLDSFVIAAKKVEEIMHPDIIDINMGCPVPKVATRAQAGSALLKNPDKVEEIVKAVVNAVNVPVTVKIRSGWDNSSINAVEIAKRVERAGASAITVHPRTKAQGYQGKADWNIIKQVKENVKIPVIGNGDIKSCCDAIMIGRATLGNPWIIKECVEYLENKKLPQEVTTKEKIEMIKKHLNNLKELKSEKQALLEIRSHIAWYLKGVPNANETKQKVFKAKTIEEIEEILKEKEGQIYE